MFEDREKLRQSIIVTILAAYLLPVLAFTFFSSGSMAQSERWLGFSVGLLIAMAGSICLILSFRKWESLAEPRCAEVPVAAPPVSSPQVKEDQQALEYARQRERELAGKLDQAKLKWHQKKRDYDELQKELRALQSEHQALENHTQEQLKKKDALLSEYAQTVNDLRAAMEKKQDQIEKLQDSVQDLSYDLDTLLKLSDFESVEEVPKEQKQEEPRPPPKEIPVCLKTFGKEEAVSLLKKCINVAQKLTTNQFSTSSRFRDLPIASTALDQRRLFESLRSETSCIIVLYSMKEGGLYFANDTTKQILGWSPDKFVQDFTQLLQSGSEEWKGALQGLSHQSHSECHLVVRDRSDELVELECLLGMIPTGAFKNFAVGIIYEP